MIKASTIKSLVDGAVKTAKAVKTVAADVEAAVSTEGAVAEAAAKAGASKTFTPKGVASFSTPKAAVAPSAAPAEAAAAGGAWAAKGPAVKAAASASAVTKLQELDLMLRDVDSLRVVLTTDAKPGDVAKLANEAGRLLELNKELRGLEDLSLASAQTTSEVAKVIKSLTAATSGRKGIFLSKEGASVDLQGPADLAAAARAAKKAPKGFGEGVAVGVDPATGARVVLQPKGAVIEDLPLMAFVKLRATRTQGAEAAKRLAADDVSLASLRTLSDVELEAKGLRSAGGPTEYVTLAGKAAEDSSLTFPTRWHKGSGDLAPRRMVVEGPFRGSYLDDVVGKIDQDALQARLKDSRAKWLSPKNSPVQPVISAIDVKQGDETVTKLRIRIPSGSEWTSARQSLSKLSEKLPTVQKVADSKGTLFVFSPNDYKFMRSVARSFALSPEAEVVRAKQIAKLTEFENISSPMNLKNFSASKIDGLKTTYIDPSTGNVMPFEFSQPQRVELARLAHNNYRDVVTLGTGLGKTAVALTALRQINLAGETRPFLVVVPKGNEGTFFAELQTRFTPAVAKEMAAKLEVLNYDQFRAASRTGKLASGETFNAKRYGAVVFDEVHNASDRNTASGKAVLKFGHPRTIEMTGTPNPDPQRLQTMLAGTQGVDLSSPAARQARLEAKRFRNLMYEEVNGIPVGVKGPTELRPGLSVDFDQQLLEWMKVNFYYVDGLDSKLGLPSRQPVKMLLSMPEELEREYRAAATPVRKGLEGLLSIHRDKGMDLIEPTKRTAQSKGSAVHEILRSQKKEVAQLDKLTNTPEKLQATGKMFRERLVADEARSTALSRALFFSDDPAYVLKSAEQLSKDVPGKYHLAALADRVEVFQNGKKLDRLGPYELPFRPGPYELNGVTLPAQQWRSFAVEQLPKVMPDIASASLHGPTHQAGLNLQWSNMVVHLDRDSWSDLNLRQREARALRRGQTRDVTVVNVDYHYATPKHTLDSPLDAVREAYANTERRLHEATLARAQKIKTTADLAPTRDSAAFDPTAWADLTYLSAGANPVPGAVGLIGAGP